MSQIGVTDTCALTQITQGLNFQSVGSAAQPVIRCIETSGSSVGDSSPSLCTSIGAYQPYREANFLQSVDLGRIEVLKGPQGTLFGHNAAGDAFNMTTLKPTIHVTCRLAWNGSADYLDDGAFRGDIALDTRLRYRRFFTTRSKLLAKLGERTEVLFAGY